MERKAAKGGWNGGGVPLGYRVNSETGCLEVEPAQAPLVPVIFDLYLNKRLGARNVANWLNEHGYRTRTGKPWSFKLLFTPARCPGALAPGATPTAARSRDLRGGAGAPR